MGACRTRAEFEVIKIHATPKGQILLGIAWMFFPVVVLLAIPWLMGATSDLEDIFAEGDSTSCVKDLKGVMCL